MITTRTIGQQILDRLKKFTSDTDITENDCILAAQQAMAQIAITQRWADKQNDFDESFDGSLYFTWFDQPVFENEHGYYFDLPASIMAVPHGMGIRVKKNLKSESYVPVASGFNSLSVGLRVNSLGGKLGFYIIGDRGYFAETTNDLVPPATVVIQMLTPIMDANPDAYAPIPASMQYQVLQLALKQLGATDQQMADETKDDVDAKG